MIRRRYRSDPVPVPDAVVEVLEEAGVDAVFGMPGGYTLKIFDALVDRRDTIRPVLARDERLAGVMAEVYGRLTGRPGVLVGQGAWLISSSMGTLEAHLGSSPVVLLTDATDFAPFSHHAPYQAGTGFYGNWDADAAFAAITKWAAIVRQPSEAVQVTQLAVKHALSGDPGPVAVIFHGEALDSHVSGDSVPRVYPSAPYLPPARVPVDPEAIAAAADAIAAARRPVLVAGNGVRLAQAGAELREIADLLRAPVATTAGGKGVFAETHELALGVFGNFGLPVANAALAESDLVIAVGTRLAPTDTANENPELLDPERQTLVQLDVDALNVGFAFPIDHALIGDARRGLRQLIDALAPRAGALRAAGGARLARLAELRERHGWFDVPQSASDEEPMTPQRAVKELQQAAADDAMLTCDAGENRLFMLHHFQTRPGMTFLQPSGAGGMGYAVPAALASKLVHPDRQAIAVCGDGGFGMSLNGLLTAIEENLPIVVAILNNRSLGWVLHGQGDRPIASTFAEFEYAGIAEAMGCHAERVSAPSDLAAAFARAFDAGRPAVVEVIISGEQTYKEVASPLAGTAE